MPTITVTISEDKWNEYKGCGAYDEEGYISSFFWEIERAIDNGETEVTID